jgi:acetylornithine deacetylase/succinyl-diaminopimelate desuccinylase-like protein
MTDSRHYVHLSRQGALRFTPHTASVKDKTIGRIHGTDERISIDDFRRALCYYHQGLAAVGSLGGGGEQQQQQPSRSVHQAASDNEL